MEFYSERGVPWLVWSGVVNERQEAYRPHGSYVLPDMDVLPGNRGRVRQSVVHRDTHQGRGFV